MLQVKEVNINYEKNPIGVIGELQFGWILESNIRNVKQSAYCLQIAEDKSFAKMVYDSKKMECEASAHVFADGFQMKKAGKYHVRVKVWTAEEESAWNEEAYFVSAFAGKDSWKGEFISAESEADADDSKGTYVRSSFCVNGEIKEAYAFTTALGLYEFYLNGKKVGKDLLTPGWTSYNKHLLYQTYDIKEVLQQGENGIGASLAAGWYKGMMGFKHHRNLYGKQTAFLCQMVIRYEDGTEQMVYTDEDWRGHDSPVEFAEIYDGEIYNAKKEISGWSNAGSNNTGMRDSWRPVHIIPYDKSILEPQTGSRVQEIDKVEAKQIFVTPQGDTVIDFGQNMSGLIHVTAAGKPGDVIELHCFEELTKEGNVYLENLRGAKQAMKYIFAREETVEYAPAFTFMGFRYAKIISYPGEPKRENFTTYSIHSNMEPTGSFRCSNPDLNQLWHNILWGLKSNFVDIPTDCPQRDERLGWTGDAQIFCRTATYLMNTYTFFKKWLTDLEADQTPEGGVPHVVPDILTERSEEDWLMSQGSHSAAAWADVAVIAPWTMYLSFGDKEILKKQYKSMKAWIDFMVNHSEDYIWNYKLQFGDWVALDAEEGSYFGATPNDLTCTAYFAYSTGLFVKILKILGKTDEALEYQDLYQNIVDKFQRTFFDSDGSMTAQTQTAHIVALYFDLTPEAYRTKTVENLKKLLEKENGHLVTGFVGTPYFCHALSRNGALKEAYELLLKDDFPSWLYQVKQGATTIWEHWDGKKPDGSMWSPDMNSFNHYAYGAIGEWMYRVAAGIEIDEEKPGYKHIVIYPHLGGNLEFVEAEYKSVYGPVFVKWEDGNERVKLTVKIPANTTATIKLYAGEMGNVDGLVFERNGELQEAEAGSGTYQIDYVKQ